MYPYIAPENFDNSRINSITNEQLIIKIDDLLKQKEVTKYITDKAKLISLIKSYCEFIKVSEDNQTLEYILPENMTVFNILNIPLKMSKDEVKKNIELVNLQYNRLYKKGFYWVLSTVDKETVICMQNSLRDLNFEESKVKYDLNNKNQIYRAMKEQVEKTSYQKEAKNLGISGNSYNKNSFSRKKGSDPDSDAFSWRKGSGEGKTSFDVNEKNNYKKNNNNNYYNKNNNQRKRSRFNSDNAQYNNNYYDNYNNYNSYNNNHNNYNNNYNNNYKNNYYNNNYNNKNNNNYNNNYRNNNTNDIEIDISNLKYPIHIKHKYSFTDIKSFYQKICDNNLFPEKPAYLSDVFNEIVSDKKKEIVVLDELIESSKLLNQVNNKETKEKEKEKINTNIKIPKMNPLSNMGKGFNSQKPPVNTHPSTVEENPKEE